MTAQHELDWGPDWEPGWEGHERMQRKYVLESTPAQRLAWLEAAIVFAHEYRGAARRGGARVEGKDRSDDT